MSTAVVRFRDDLWVHDNEPLALAAHEYDEVVPLYTFDPRYEEMRDDD